MKSITTELSKLAQDVLFGMQHGLFDDVVGQSLLRNYEANTCDEELRAMIHQRVTSEQYRQAFSQMPFQSPQLRDSELILGRDFQGKLVSIPISYFNAHTLMIANSGAGKTTLMRFYALQIARLVRGLWLIDLRKREFRMLRKYLALMGINLIVIPGHSLKINILQIPEGVETADFIPRIADCLVMVLTLPPRASKLIQTTLHKLYRQFGIFEGKKLYPTLFDLFVTIKKDTKANPPARQALLDSLEPVLYSLGPVINFHQGWSTQDLAQRHLVFELTDLSETDKNLILNYLLVSEFTSRIARNISNPKMDFLVMVDEAQRMACASQEHYSPVGDLVTLLRGTGIGLFLGAQSSIDIHHQILANTSFKIMGRVGNIADYMAMGRTIGLTSEQVQWSQHHLCPGLFIGQVGEGNWRYPFIFKVPHPRFDKTVPKDSNADATNRDPLPELPVIPSA